MFSCTGSIIWPLPSCSANLHVIFVNLKQVAWYQRRIQNLVKHLEAVNCFHILDVRKGSEYGSGYCSLFEKKTFIVLNLAIKT